MASDEIISTTNDYRSCIAIDNFYLLFLPERKIKTIFHFFWSPAALKAKPFNNRKRGETGNGERRRMEQ